MIVTEANPASAPAESFRTLRTAIRHKRIRPESRGMVVMVSSPGRREGKTTTLSNLAVAYAQEGKSVVAVDGNLRHPALHEAFGIPNQKGLIAYHRDRTPAGQSVVPSGYSRLDLMPAGGTPANPSELIGSDRTAELLEELRGIYDVILLDSPAALEFADAELLAEYSDGVLLVVELGKTKRERAAKARSRLEESGARLLGTVLNK